MSFSPIEAAGSATAAVPVALPEAIAVARPSGEGSFAQMLSGGVESVNQKLLQADAAATAFALDDSVPLHQVTYALEQARLSFELMLQVRARLVEGYQELMRMQL